MNSLNRRLYGKRKIRTTFFRPELAYPNPFRPSKSANLWRRWMLLIMRSHLKETWGCRASSLCACGVTWKKSNEGETPGGGWDVHQLRGSLLICQLYVQPGVLAPCIPSVSDAGGMCSAAAVTRKFRPCYQRRVLTLKVTKSKLVTTISTTSVVGIAWGVIHICPAAVTRIAENSKGSSRRVFCLVSFVIRVHEVKARGFV